MLHRFLCCNDQRTAPLPIELHSFNLSSNFIDPSNFLSIVGKLRHGSLFNIALYTAYEILHILAVIRRTFLRVLNDGKTADIFKRAQSVKALPKIGLQFVLQAFCLSALAIIG